MHEHFGRWRGERGFSPRGFGREDEGEGMGHGRRGHGFGRGFSRPFDHGELRLVILTLIGEKPRHGYEIIKAIEDQFGGSYTPSPGVVYPTLTMLEEMGHATVEESGGKKLYTITAEGRDYLVANRMAAEAAMARMRHNSHGRGPSPQLIRALGNLKLSLRLRHRQGPITEEQLRNIVAIIDAAALAIERS